MTTPHQMEDVLSYLHRIGVLDDAFNLFFREHPEAEDQQPPPTSSKVLRQLPTISVKPEDLIDENNRTCCICLEKNNVGDRVKRLPCAHIFHEDCIMSWLKKTCTCPVCRYELETDNPHFEQSRKERMRDRKARVHSYELDRMSVIELLAFARKNQIDIPAQPPGSPDYKNLLVETISNSGRIEIIADAPTPNIEYTLEDLRSMKVSELRKAMEDAGVFFDPLDVIEKEDMVRIFCNSGRFILVGQKSGQGVDTTRNQTGERTVYQPPKPPEATAMISKQINEKVQTRRHQATTENRSTASMTNQKLSLNNNDNVIPRASRNSTPRLSTRPKRSLRRSAPADANPQAATSQPSSRRQQQSYQRASVGNNTIRNSGFVQNQGTLSQRRQARQRQSIQTDRRRFSQKQGTWNISHKSSDDSSSSPSDESSNDESMWC